MYLSSSALLYISLFMVAGGVMWQAGIVNIVSLLLLAGLGTMIALINMYMSPMAIMILATCCGIAGIVFQKGISPILSVVLSAALAALVYFGHMYLPPAILVRLSLTIILLVGLRFILL